MTFLNFSRYCNTYTVDFSIEYRMCLIHADELVQLVMVMILGQSQNDRTRHCWCVFRRIKALTRPSVRNKCLWCEDKYVHSFSFSQKNQIHTLYYTIAIVSGTDLVLKYFLLCHGPLPTCKNSVCAMNEYTMTAYTSWPDTCHQSLTVTIVLDIESDASAQGRQVARSTRSNAGRCHRTFATQSQQQQRRHVHANLWQASAILLVVLARACAYTRAHTEPNCLPQPRRHVMYGNRDWSPIYIAIDCSVAFCWLFLKRLWDCFKLCRLT